VKSAYFTNTARFEVFPAVLMKIQVLWHIMPCRLVSARRIFKGPRYTDMDEMEEIVVQQHNLFRKMYSDNETTCFGM